MNEQFLLISISIISVLMLFLIFGCLWLLREYKKLKQSHQQLAKQIQRANEDLAGICSAAIAVDSRIAVNETCIGSLIESINTFQTMSQAPINDDEIIEDSSSPPQGYELAIEKIHHGANVEELVKRFGLTRDEAVLLTRLHGKDRS